MGTVVVEDGAGAVDDFLIALDLRNDLLLHLHRRQGDLDSLQISLGDVNKSNSAVQVFFNFDDRLVQRVEQIHLGRSGFIEANLEDVLVEHRPLTIPNMRTKGRAP